MMAFKMNFRFAILSVLLSASTAFAGSSVGSFSLNGYYTVSGTPVTASVPFNIAVSDQSGCYVYAENQASVSVNAGYFSIQVGNGVVVGGSNALDSMFDISNTAIGGNTLPTFVGGGCVANGATAQWQAVLTANGVLMGSIPITSSALSTNSFKAKYAASSPAVGFAFPGSTSGTITIAAQPITNTFQLTLPSALPAVSGYLLQSDTSGNLSWVAPSGGGAVTSVSVSAPISNSGTATAPVLGLSGTIPIANGGTNSATALNSGRIMISSGGQIVEAAAMSNGQILIGSTGGAPSAATLTGTANEITITNSSGAIQISTPQAIATGSSPTFSNLTLSSLGSGIATLTSGVLGATSSIPIANGGTGATTQQGALNALAGSVTNGNFLRGNGTNVLMTAIAAGDLPGSITSNTSGTAANVTGMVGVANGGTGQSGALTANGLIYASTTSAMASLGTGSAGQVLTSNGTGSAPSWQVAGANGFQNGGNGFGASATLGTTDANTLSFLTNNFTRMTIAAGTGRVGIGSTIPGALLDLGASGTPGTLRLEGTTSGFVQFQTQGLAGSWTMTLPSNAGANGQVLATDGVGNLSWVTSGGGGGALPTSGGTMTGQLVTKTGASAGAPGLSFGGDTSTGFYDVSTGVIGVSSNGSQAMTLSSTGIAGSGAFTLAAGGANQNLTLNSSGTGVTTINASGTGNVGIGVANPGAFFEVNGTSIFDSYMTVKGYIISQSAAAGIVNPSYYTYNNANTAGSGTSIVFLGNNASYNQVNVSTVSAVMTDPTAGSEFGDLYFSTLLAGVSNEKMRITSLGNVGIGTNSPSARLQVGSAISNMASTSNYMTIDAAPIPALANIINRVDYAPASPPSQYFGADSSYHDFLYGGAYDAVTVSGSTNMSAASVFGSASQAVSNATSNLDMLIGIYGGARSALGSVNGMMAGNFEAVNNANAGLGVNNNFVLGVNATVTNSGTMGDSTGSYIDGSYMEVTNNAVGHMGSNANHTVVTGSDAYVTNNGSIYGPVFGSSAYVTNNQAINGNVYGSASYIDGGGPIAGNVYGVYSDTSSATLVSGHIYDFYAFNQGAMNYFAGAVGIGSNSPSAYLDVSGVSSSTSTINPLLYLHNTNNGTNTTAGLIFGMSSISSYQKQAIFSNYTNGAWGVGSLNFAVNTVADSTIVSPADTKMVIAQTGNVGIGSITPNATLDVGGFIEHIGQSRLTSTYSVTNNSTLTTGSTIAGWSQTPTLVAGKTYAFDITLYTTSSLSMGIKADLGGGTALASSIIGDGIYFSAATMSQTRITALGTPVCAVTAVSTATCHITGTITVSTGGTFLPRFAQNASGAATSTVAIGSTMILQQIN